MELKDYELLLYKRRDIAIKTCFKKNEVLIREAVNSKGDFSKHPNVIEKLHFLTATQEKIMDSVKKYFTEAREKRKACVNDDHFTQEMNALLMAMDADLQTILTELNTYIKNEQQ